MAEFRYSYDSLVYYGEDISESIDRVARFGYDAIELVGEPAELDGGRIKKLADDAGIAISSVCSIYTAERDLAHPDAEMRKKAVQYVKDVADLAAHRRPPRGRPRPLRTARPSCASLRPGGPGPARLCRSSTPN